MIEFLILLVFVVDWFVGQAVSREVLPTGRRVSAERELFAVF